MSNSIMQEPHSQPIQAGGTGGPVPVKKAFLTASALSSTTRSVSFEEKESDHIHSQSEPNSHSHKKKPRRYIRVNRFCACLCPCLLKEFESKQSIVSFVPASASRIVAEGTIQVKNIPGLLPFQELLNLPDVKEYEPLPKDIPIEPLSIGIFLHERGEIRIASQCFNHAANNGHPVGIYLYAIALRHGWGIEEDFKHAFELFQLSAQSIIEALKVHPEGTQSPPTSSSRRVSSDDYGGQRSSNYIGAPQPQDRRRSSESFAKAAFRKGSVFQEDNVHSPPSLSPRRASHATSMFKNRGSKTSLTSSFNPPPQMMRPLFKKFASAMSIPNLKDIDIIREFLPLPVMEIGMCYMYGWGVTQSRSTGAYFVQISAQLGDADAQFQLGHLYLSGIGVRRSKMMAAKWLRLAEAGGRKEMNQAWIWKPKYDESSSPDRNQLDDEELTEKIGKSLSLDGDAKTFYPHGEPPPKKPLWKRLFSMKKKKKD